MNELFDIEQIRFTPIRFASVLSIIIVPRIGEDDESEAEPDAFLFDTIEMRRSMSVSI